MSRSMVFPFSIEGGSVASTIDPVKQLEQKIIAVLVTGKQERSGNAGFGAELQQLLFDNIDDLVQADFKVEASYEITRNITGVQIIDIRVIETDESTAEVTVYYQTPLAPATSTTFNISLPGVLTEESPL